MQSRFRAKSNELGWAHASSVSHSVNQWQCPSGPGRGGWRCQFERYQPLLCGQDHEKILWSRMKRDLLSLYRVTLGLRMEPWGKTIILLEPVNPYHTPLWRKLQMPVMYLHRILETSQRYWLPRTKNSVRKQTKKMGSNQLRGKLARAKPGACLRQGSGPATQRSREAQARRLGKGRYAAGLTGTVSPSRQMANCSRETSDWEIENTVNS